MVVYIFLGHVISMGVSGDEVDDGDKDHDKEGDDHDDVGNHESVG